MSLTTVYIDLDGTLLDVGERYWRLHSDLTTALAMPQLERDAFWSMKRERASYLALSGNVSADLAERYRGEWIANIESEEYLAFDRPFAATMDVLTALNERHRVVLATMRSNRQLLEDQLQRLDLARYFAVVLRDGSGSADQGDKVRLLNSDPDGVRAHAAMVGDTEVDIRAAHDLGMWSVGVTTGLRSRHLLASLKPDALIDETALIPTAIQRGVIE